MDAHVMDDRSYVLQALFDLLEEDGIPYCVVGDVRELPERIASDVDLVVPHDAFAQTPRALAWFCRTFDLRLVQMIRHEQSALYFILAWSGESGELRTLAIDVCSDYRRAGRRLLGAEELLAQRERARDESGASRGGRRSPAAGPASEEEGGDEPDDAQQRVVRARLRGEYVERLRGDVGSEQ